MDKLFHKSTWADVKAGDTVLMVLKRKSPDRIVEVQVVSCRREKEWDDESSMVVLFDFDDLHYGQVFNPNETVYVQSRL